MKISPHLLITGASGYLGRELTAQAVAGGWRVTACGRQRPLRPDVRFMQFDLGRSKIVLPADAQALVHLAYDRSERETTEAQEIGAGIELMETAKRAGVHMVLVSSQSAGEDAITRYARVKWALEQAAFKLDVVVIRLGLVYGGEKPAGLYAELLRLIQRLPVLPKLDPDILVQPIHLEDACSALLAAAATGPAIRGDLLCVASPSTIGLSDFLRLLDRRILRRRRLSLPVPSWLLEGLLTTAAAAFGSWAKRVGQYNSLKHAASMDVTASLIRLGVQPRSIEDGLRLSKREVRRGLAKEGQALLRYVGSECPSTGLVARYVRAVTTIRSGSPVNLPRLAFRFPAMIRLREGRGLFGSVARDDELERRLDIAVRLREASPREAKGYISLTSVNPIWAVAHLTLLALQEGGWMLLRVISLPFQMHVRRDPDC